MLSMISKIDCQSDKIKILVSQLEDNIPDPFDQDNYNITDISDQIQLIHKEEEKKQFETLQKIENALKNKQMILDKIENK